MTSGRSAFNPRRRDAVLTALRRNANVSAAARRVGVHRVTLYRWRDAHPEFAEAWDDAVEEAIDAVEAEALRRAMEGTARPVFYQGRQCGEIRYYSDALIMFVLRSRRPWRYALAGELARREGRGAGEPPLTVELVHFGDRETFEAGKARFDAARAAGGGQAAGAIGLADRLAGGTCLSTDAPTDGGPPRT